MSAKILEGNVLETLKDLPACSVQCVVTSPPYYGLRDYGVEGQIGLESTPEVYVQQLVKVFREVWRVLKDDGTLWLNLGDSYNGSGKGGNPEGSPFIKQKTNQGSLLDRPTRISGLKPKDLIGIPWMVAFALRSDGWYLRQDIIWAKPNPMPESVTDRCTKSHEYIFLLSKSAQYYYDYEAIKEPAALSSVERWSQDIEHQIGSGRVPGKTNGNMKAVGGPRNKSQSFKRDSRIEKLIPGQAKNSHRSDRDENQYDLYTRNKRDVWTVSTKPYKEAHFAMFPPDLIEPCILAGSREGDTVLDPFNGLGTTGEVSIKHHRLYIGCELNPKYVKLTYCRLSQVQPVLMQGRSLTKREPDNGDSAPSQAFSQSEFLSDLEGLS
jgi:DNA modification methylase